jgi:predicted HD phosphohydrolase
MVSEAALTEAKGGEDWSDNAHERTVATMDALKTQANFSYGEGVNMLQHALQAAQCATEQGETIDAILSAVAHDVGNAPQARAAWVAAGNPDPQLLVSSSDGSIGYENHAEVGGHYLEKQGFSPEVCNAVRLHVDAKRALVAMDPVCLVLADPTCDPTRGASLTD